MKKNKFWRSCCICLLLVIFHFSAYSQVTSEKGGQLFGDWVVRCENPQERNFLCKMSQMAVIEETAETLMQINIFYQPNTTQPSIQFVLPLGISLKTAPVLTLDQKMPTPLVIDLCVPDGCYSTFNLSAELLEAMLGMKTGQIDLHTGDGRLIQLPVSGAGSRDAYDAMTTMAQHMRPQDVQR